MLEDIIEEGANNEVVDSETERRTYPIKLFRSIEPFVGNVYKKYGGGEILSLEKIADANNLAVNSIKQTVSTCCQYSCFVKNHGKGYKITDDFTKIFHPENDEERTQTIIKCLKNVPFYSQLFNDYNEKVVPSIEGLQNRFIREYKMKQHIAKGAAEIFIQNLKDYGLINARNVLIIRGEVKSNVPPSGNNDGNISNSKNSTPPPANGSESEKESIKIPIKLKGNRMAYLIFPIDLTDEDLLKVFKVTKAYIEAYGDNIDLNDV